MVLSTATWLKLNTRSPAPTFPTSPHTPHSERGAASVMPHNVNTDYVSNDQVLGKL